MYVSFFMENKSFDYKLNIENLKNIPFHLYENDFTFHLEGKTYKTNRFIADLLSPYARQLHYSDRSIDEFYIEFDKSIDQGNGIQMEEDYFSDFLNLYAFNDIKIDPKRQKYYAKYFYALGNIDEFLHLQPEYSTDISEDNAVDRLLLLINIIGKHEMTINMPGIGTIRNLINFISRHFENIDKEKMKLLNIDIIEKIINNENLKLHDEDSLLNFLLEIYSKDDRFCSLFEYVIFNNVSKEMMEKFIQQFDINHMNLSIWKTICQRLFGNTKSFATRYSEKAKVVHILHDKEKEFQGIMQHLNAETGGNVHDNGTVEITSNSIGGDCHPKNLVDYQNNDSYYGSDINNKELSYVCFDFKDKLVNLDSYTIKSNSNSSINNPKSWVVEVSNDGEKWEIIDRHENSSSLKGCKIIYTFKVQQANYGFFRYIRLHQTGEGWDRSDKRIWFYKLEFYGDLKYAQK